jgi:hypothetical protein
MISVVNGNGDKLDVAKDIQVDMEFNNPCFPADGATIPGSFSMPIVLPGTKHNHKSLQYLHRLDVSGKVYDYDNVSVLFRNNKILQGKLVFSKLSQLRYEGNLVVNGFPLDIFGKSLREINYGNDVNIGAGNPLQVVGTVAATHDYKYYGATRVMDITPYNGTDQRPLMFQFPMHSNPSFYADEGSTDSPNPQYCGFVNLYDNGPATTPINMLGPEGEGPNYNKHVLVPWLYVSFILERIFASIGYTLNGSFINDYALKKLLLYNNYALDKTYGDGYAYVHASTAGPVQFPIENNVIPTDPFSRIPFFRDYLDEDTDVNNRWSNIGHIYTPSIEDDYQIILDIQFLLDGPVTTANWFIEINIMNGTTVLFNELLVLAPGDVHQYEYLKDLTCYLAAVTPGDYFFAEIRVSNTDLPIADFYVEGSFIVKPTYAPVWNQYNPTIKLVNHVPDMKVDDFISNLCKLWNLRIVPDVANKSVSLEFAELIFGLRVNSVNGAKSYFSNVKDYTAKAQAIYDAEPPRLKRRLFQFDWSNEPLADGNFKKLPDGSTLFKYGSYAVYIGVPMIVHNIGDFVYIENQNRYYTVALDESTSQKILVHYSDGHFPFTLGTGETIEHTVSITPVLMGDFTNYGILLPRFNERGSSTEFDDTGINEFGAKLAFWDGLRHYGAGIFFPLCTSIGKGPTGVGSLFTGYSICFGDIPYSVVPINSINSTYWSMWEDFEQNTELVYRNILFDINDVADFNFAKMWRIDHIDYIAKRVKAPFTDDGILMSECELYRVML